MAEGHITGRGESSNHGTKTRINHILCSRVTPFYNNPDDNVLKSTHKVSQNVYSVVRSCCERSRWTFKKSTMWEAVWIFFSWLRFRHYLYHLFKSLPPHYPASGPPKLSLRPTSFPHWRPCLHWCLVLGLKDDTNTNNMEQKHNSQLCYIPKVTAHQNYRNTSTLCCFFMYMYMVLGHAEGWAIFIFLSSGICRKILGLCFVLLGTIDLWNNTN